jgi:hypothetical protein
VLSKIGEMSGGTVKLIDKDRSFAAYKQEHHVAPDIEHVDGGQLTIIDVTMTTCQPSLYCGKTDAQIEEAVMRAEQAKIAKFEAVAAEKKASFYPFAVERNTLAFGKHARRLIDMFCVNSLQCGRHGALSPFLVNATLAVAVARANANLVREVLNKNVSASIRRDRRVEAET